MKIDRVHFYVEDGTTTSNWFIHNLGFQAIANYHNSHTHTTVIVNNSICFVISAPLNDSSPVASYLNSHAPGVVDIAFRVENIESIIAKAKVIGVKVLQPLQMDRSPQGEVKWSKVQGWESLEHTLIEQPNSQSDDYFLFDLGIREYNRPEMVNSDIAIADIDHIVLNVAAGELTPAVYRYQALFDFELQQTFKIQTERSGLYSQALVDSSSQVQFNINEPTTTNSQIQTFLDLNQGAGIQHLALRSLNIIETVTQMRAQDVPFLPVPQTYYERLQQKYGDRSIPCLQDGEWLAIQKAQILIDGNDRTPRSLLMQTFSQPIFNKPTFFLELIERRQQAQGFGEGNFQALFEAVEQSIITEVV